MSLLAEGLKSAARRSPQGHICDVWCNEHWRLHNHSHYQFLRILNLVLIQVWCCQWSFQADLWLRSKADCLRAVHGLRTRQEGRGLAALWESSGRKEMSLHKNRNGRTGEAGWSCLHLQLQNFSRFVSALAKHDESAKSEPYPFLRRFLISQHAQAKVELNPVKYILNSYRIQHNLTISMLMRLRSSFNWIAGFSSTRRTCHVQNANAIYSNSERIFTENALQRPDSSQKISPFTDSPWALLLLHHEEPFVFHGSCSWAAGRHPVIQSWCVRSTELDTS